MKALTLIALLAPAITHAAIVQDAEDAWRATATVEDGALYLDIDPAGKPDWICAPDRLHVAAGDLVSAEIDVCDEINAPAKVLVTGGFDPAAATTVIWNGARIRVRQATP